MGPEQNVVVESITRVDTPEGRSALRKRRGAYLGFSVLLGALAVLLALDVADVADVYGVKSGTVSGRGGGYELEVRYGTVSRPGLATPFDITVSRAGGLPDPVVLAIDGDYLSMWDENAVHPLPTDETRTGEQLVWRFTPPEGSESLTISYDGSIEPGVHRGKTGRVAVLEDGRREVLSVEFTTRVMP